MKTCLLWSESFHRGHRDERFRLVSDAKNVKKIVKRSLLRCRKSYSLEMYLALMDAEKIFDKLKSLEVERLTWFSFKYFPLDLLRVAFLVLRTEAPKVREIPPKCPKLLFFTSSSNDFSSMITDSFEINPDSLWALVDEEIDEIIIKYFSNSEDDPGVPSSDPKTKRVLGYGFEKRWRRHKPHLLMEWACLKSDEAVRLRIALLLINSVFVIGCIHTMDGNRYWVWQWARDFNCSLVSDRGTTEHTGYLQQEKQVTCLKGELWLDDWRSTNWKHSIDSRQLKLADVVA